MKRRFRLLAAGVLTAVVAGLAGGLVAAPSAGAAPTAQVSLPDVLGCKDAPTPEVPGRGVVGFFQSDPKQVPPAGDPFAANSTTTIYEQYGYAGLRWNTYDLGCGPDIARAPDATVGTAVANWIIALPKAAVAATGAVVGAAFSPDFLGVFDPLIDNVVQTLRVTVFEQWGFLVIAALGLLLIWRARQASLASSAAAIGWALLVMVLVTMVFRWPLVAGHAADTTVTSTLSAVTGGLNNADGSPTAVTGDSGDAGDTDGGTDAGSKQDAALGAVSGMQEALLYQAWLGGTFGSANSAVAKQYGPAIFASTALTWREAQVLRTDPAAGKKIIEAKEKSFEETAAKIKAEDPDSYDYLTGQRSDSRVGYALLAGLATLCAVPFLFAAALLVIGALVIVRFGVMLFPAFATLGLFPTMRTLVTGVGSTVAAALINAIVFGIGAAVTVRGMGLLLAPSSAVPPWLAIVLMLLLTIVMWVALRPFRRLTQMVSAGRNHFGEGAGAVGSVTRGAARTSGRILTTAMGTFLGVAAANRKDELADARTEGTPQRIEAMGSYPTTAPAALASTVRITSPSVTVSAPAPTPSGSPGSPGSSGSVGSAGSAGSVGSVGSGVSAGSAGRSGGSGARTASRSVAEGRSAGAWPTGSSSGPASGPSSRPSAGSNGATTSSGSASGRANSGSRYEGRWAETAVDGDRSTRRAETWDGDPRLDDPDLDEVFRPAPARQR